MISKYVYTASVYNTMHAWQNCRTGDSISYLSHPCIHTLCTGNCTSELNKVRIKTYTNA